jgi:hypothetical protein
MPERLITNSETDSVYHKKRKTMKHIISISIALFLFSFSLTAQDDLEKLLNADEPEPVNYATAAFKATRVINMQSIERMRKRQLEFRIHHRFGEVATGAYELWGLDQANIHFSLEYGLTDWVTVGIGRGTYQKTYVGSAKFSLLRQSTGAKNMPVFLSYFTSVSANSLNTDVLNDYFSSRLSYVNQLLIARKFSDEFSLQLAPTVIHRNLVKESIEPNDLFALGLGGRLKITKRISFNLEYFYVYRPLETDYHNPISVGFDIETGGHVFQLMLTNSLAMTEKGFIGETTGDWTKRGFHLGFNISRPFAF